MKATNNNKYVYETTEGIAYGFFNIYQARNGGIYLQMCDAAVALSDAQISRLPFDIYKLKDFDYDAFKNYYLHDNHPAF